MIHHRSGPPKPLSQDAIRPTTTRPTKGVREAKGPKDIGSFVGSGETQIDRLCHWFNGIIRNLVGSIRITAGKVRNGFNQDYNQNPTNH